MPLADPKFLAMIGAAWLLSYAVHSTLLLGSTWLLVTCRRIPASLEQTLWRTALVGSLLTATVLVMGWDGGAWGARLRLVPSLPLPVSALWIPGVSGDSPEAASPAGWNLQVSPLWTWVVLSIWAITAGWGLLRLIGARRRLHRELGPRIEVEDGPARARLDALCARAGLTRPARLTLSRELGAPIAVGQDEICLPLRALQDLDDAELESALAHELGHLAGRDPQWRGFAGGMGAVFFFQPLLGPARRRLAESAEFLADDWAVRHTGADLSLARCLARVAGWYAPGLPAAAVSAMADPESPLVRRVERILGRRPVEPSPLWRGIGAAVLLLAVWSLAPGVTALSPARGPVETAELWVASEAPVVSEAPVAPVVTVAPEAPETPTPPAVVSRVERRTLVVFISDAPRARAQARAHVRPHRRLAPRWRDEDTAPRAVVIPYEEFRIQVDARRSLLGEEFLRAQSRALLDAQRQLHLLELHHRALEHDGFLVPATPAPPPTPTVLL